MTKDKQIIIDCVDVSGCEWFYKNDPCKNTCKYFCTPCEWVEIQNCMYKYAKRKEQECERLKNERTLDLVKQLDQLKAENDELKKANVHIDNNRMVKADKLKRIEDLIIACNSGYTDEFIQNLLVILHEPEPCFENKLSKTLAEIKEIAEEYQKQYIVNNGVVLLCNQILQKISECEGNDEM